MAMKKSKGFTIVELLVVIAIIAALASIVLVSAVQYINSSKNASVKSNLSSVLINGSIYYENNDSAYGINGTTNFCTSPYFTNPSAAITAIGATAICNVASDYTTWCSCSTELGSTNTFCVDSTNNKKETTIDCTTECPTEAACQ
jgi:prepilin-type N-terminal cleavage/methylation domain-containing protein